MTDSDDWHDRAELRIHLSQEQASRAQAIVNELRDLDARLERLMVEVLDVGHERDMLRGPETIAEVTCLSAALHNLDRAERALGNLLALARP